MTTSDWITTILGVLGIVASLFTASRDYRSRRVGERIDRLSTIQRELVNLGVGGMDARVDELSRASAHQALLDRTRVAMRRNAAEYVAIASKPNPSRLTAALLILYGLGVVVAGLQLAGSAVTGRPTNTGASMSSGLVLVGTGAAIFAFGVRHARLVRTAWKRDRESGVNLTSWPDELRHYWINAQKLFARRFQRD